MAPAGLRQRLFGQVEERLEELVDLDSVVVTELDDQARASLATAEVLLTGWGAPHLDAELMASMPRLRAIFHAGGSVRALVDPELLVDRGIVASNAGEANAVPVAEYTLAMILLAGKQSWASERLYRERRAFIDREQAFADSGNFERVVGIVGASRIGRKVLELLRHTDVHVLLYDPYLSTREAAELGAELVSLPELAKRSAVVSIHAPVTPETVGMIDASFIDAMPTGATFINTARGAVVDQEALVSRLRSGEISAVLDVTSPDPLPTDHPLWNLPNVVLTPHIAGAMGNELTRLGYQVVDEVERFLTGRPLQWREV